MIVWAIKNGNELEFDNITLREANPLKYIPKLAPALFMISPDETHLKILLDYYKSINDEEFKDYKIVKVEIKEVEERNEKVFI